MLGKHLLAKPKHWCAVSPSQSQTGPTWLCQASQRCYITYSKEWCYPITLFKLCLETFIPALTLNHKNTEMIKRNSDQNNSDLSKVCISSIQNTAKDFARKPFSQIFLIQMWVRAKKTPPNWLVLPDPALSTHQTHRGCNTSLKEPDTDPSLFWNRVWRPRCFRLLPLCTLKKARTVNCLH